MNTQLSECNQQNRATVQRLELKIIDLSADNASLMNEVDADERRAAAATTTTTTTTTTITAAADDAGADDNDDHKHDDNDTNRHADDDDVDHDDDDDDDDDVHTLRRRITELTHTQHNMQRSMNAKKQKFLTLVDMVRAHKDEVAAAFTREQGLQAVVDKLTNTLNVKKEKFLKLVDVTQTLKQQNAQLRVAVAAEGGGGGGGGGHAE
jgi:chromosome segregation ATPase